MDKLSLHETFRIYLPGLLFCITSYALFLDTTKEIGQVLIPALFVGFAINVPLYTIGKFFFNYINDRYTININRIERTFEQHQSNILRQKHKQFKAQLGEYDIDIDDVTKLGLMFSTQALLSRNYDGSETSSFRMPKSLGVMCFNFSILSLAIPIVFLLYALITLNASKEKTFRSLMISLALSSKSASFFFAFCISTSLFMFRPVSNFA